MSGGGEFVLLSSTQHSLVLVQAFRPKVFVTGRLSDVLQHPITSNPLGLRDSGWGRSLFVVPAQALTCRLALRPLCLRVLALGLCLLFFPPLITSNPVGLRDSGWEGVCLTDL